MRTNRFFLFMMLLAAPLMLTQAQTPILEVFKWDNTKVQVGLSDLGKITFSGSDMVLNLKSGELNTIPTGDIRNLVFNTVSSVPNAVSVKTLSVYPNPAQDYIRIEHVQGEHQQLSIFSLSGQVLHNILLSEGENQIDIRHLHRGIYLVKVGTQVTKFTKQ